MEEPNLDKRKSRKEKKLKRRYRVYKKGGAFRTKEGK